MLIAASIVADATTGAGLMAAAIAVCGFLAHVKPALARRDDAALREATTIGGLVGFLFAVGLIAVSWFG